MRRAAAVMTAAGAVLWVASLAAQGKPNFAGKWTPDTEKNAAAMSAMGGGGGGGRGGGRGGGMMGGGDMTISQDATSITIERTGGRGNAQPITYKLDGSEQSVQTGRGGESKVKASWDGNTIVIETTSDFNGNTRTTKAVYSMEGDELVIATTQPPRGGQGEAMTRKVYYKKAG
jgi:hypothetical protein